MEGRGAAHRKRKADFKATSTYQYSINAAQLTQIIHLYSRSESALLLIELMSFFFSSAHIKWR